MKTVTSTIARVRIRATFDSCESKIDDGSKTDSTILETNEVRTDDARRSSNSSSNVLRTTIRRSRRRTRSATRSENERFATTKRYDAIDVFESEVSKRRALFVELNDEFSSGIRKNANYFWNERKSKKRRSTVPHFRKRSNSTNYATTTNDSTNFESRIFNRDSNGSETKLYDATSSRRNAAYARRTARRIRVDVRSVRQDVRRRVRNEFEFRISTRDADAFDARNDATEPFRSSNVRERTAFIDNSNLKDDPKFGSKVRRDVDGRIRRTISGAN